MASTTTNINTEVKMKTKEEVIQKAWGIYWDEVKSNVVGMGINGGWADNDVIHYNEDLGCDSKGLEFSGTLYRPKSLLGIENNNGWIKIESEKDLPKEISWCVLEVFKNNGITQAEWWGNDKERSKYWMENISHYRPPVKHKPPIY